MTGTTPDFDREISLFAVGTVLLRNRWRILRWMLIGGAIAVAAVWSRPKLYTASASFMPQGYDAGRSGLAGLAGQFGVTVPGQSQALSPEFYSRLTKSRVILEPIVRQDITVAEMGNRRVPFMTLFKIPAGNAPTREEDAVKTLSAIVGVSVAKTTGVVQLSIATEWPSASLAIMTQLIDGINAYNQRTRQGQAASERKFVEARLGVATTDLRAAEDRLQSFLQGNRQIGSSAQLTFERDRLQREVALRQAVHGSLVQAYEEVRIREVRDTPVVTIFEPPAVRAKPEPRGRLKTVILGLVLGALIGGMLSLMSAVFSRWRAGRNPEADEFVSSLGDIKREILSVVPGKGDRARA